MVTQIIDNGILSMLYETTYILLEKNGQVEKYSVRTWIIYRKHQIQKSNEYMKEISNFVMKLKIKFTMLFEKQILNF